MAKIFCFGDSITYGADDLSVSGWTTRLRLYLDKKSLEDSKYEGLVYNLGIPGETTEGLIKRFVLETGARIREDKDEENIFIFAYGTNDAAFIPSNNSFRVGVDIFRDNLNETIARAKKFSDKIFILTITPVVDELTTSPINKDKSRTNEYIEKYNNIIIEIVQEQDITLIDSNSVYLNQNYKELVCEDGLHPNDRGHKVIFNTVKEKLLPFI